MNEYDRYLALAGRAHTFEDGVEMRIIQVKIRETGPWVTYESDYGGSIPRRFVLPVWEFLDTFGHLFPLEDSQ
jgi:hypothetical protein